MVSPSSLAPPPQLPIISPSGAAATAALLRCAPGVAPPQPCPRTPSSSPRLHVAVPPLLATPPFRSRRAEHWGSRGSRRRADPAVLVVPQGLEKFCWDFERPMVHGEFTHFNSPEKLLDSKRRILA